MSLILHLETSTKACSVALSEMGQLLFVKESLTDEYSHSENLTIYIESVLKDSGKELKDLKAISVASGPGSYTGLRIGVSTAKGLCYGLSIPLISIGSLDSLIEIAANTHKNVNLCAMIDARRKEVYACIKNFEGTLIKPVSADILDKNSYVEFEPFVYFGDGTAKMMEDWNGRNCTADLTINASASGQIGMAYSKFLKQEFEDVAYFEPFYLKDFVTN